MIFTIESFLFVSFAAPELQITIHLEDILGSWRYYFTLFL